MSDQPPSYGGHPNYAQQWPPAYPSMIPPNFPGSSDYSHRHQPLATNPVPTFDYNMAGVNANSRMPGSNGTGNSAFVPPPFPFFNHFDASQFPPPFPPMPFAPMSYPPMPTGSSNPAIPYQGLDGHASHQLSTEAVRLKDTPVQADNHREEGEVSEESDEKSLQPTARKSTHQHLDLEEGETISSSARSARSSGSRITPLRPHIWFCFTNSMQHTTLLCQSPQTQAWSTMRCSLSGRTHPQMSPPLHLANPRRSYEFKPKARCSAWHPIISATMN